MRQPRILWDSPEYYETAQNIMRQPGQWSHAGSKVLPRTTHLQVNVEWITGCETVCSGSKCSITQSNAMREILTSLEKFLIFVSYCWKIHRPILRRVQTVIVSVANGFNTSCLRDAIPGRLTLTYCVHLSHVHLLYVTCPWSFLTLRHVNRICYYYIIFLMRSVPWFPRG